MSFCSFLTGLDLGLLTGKGGRVRRSPVQISDGRGQKSEAFCAGITDGFMLTQRKEKSQCVFAFKTNRERIKGKGIIPGKF